MIRIKNTADDRTKHLLHRTSTRFELEPILGSKRIRLGTHIDIDDEYYERVKHLVAPWIKNGMVEVTKLSDIGKVAADGIKELLSAPSVVSQIISEGSIQPMDKKVLFDNLSKLSEEGNGNEELKAEDEVAITDSLTTTLEPAGAPVVVEDKSSSDSSKKGPGKKKLF